MFKSIFARLDPQSTIVSVFSTVMILSLVCSLSAQPSHASGTKADSVQLVQ